jgi:hypothetical protein
MSGDLCHDLAGFRVKHGIMVPSVLDGSVALRGFQKFPLIAISRKLKGLDSPFLLG